MRTIRALLQYLVLAAAGVLLLLGAGRLGTAPRTAEPEPVSVTTVQTDPEETSLPPAPTEAETCPPPELEDVVDAGALAGAE